MVATVARKGSVYLGTQRGRCHVPGQVATALRGDDDVPPATPFHGEHCRPAVVDRTDCAIE